MAEPKVYVFWDNSNIFISAQHVAERRDGITMGPAIRIQFDHLLRLAHAGRPIGRALAVGSIPPEMKHLWERFKASGVEVKLYERGQTSHKEQGVDACLQVEMLRVLADNPGPQIAVLLTGDGAGYEDGVGFRADMERMAKAGWGIEVIAWDISCNRKLKEWAGRVGVFVSLEDHYESVTFIEGTRIAHPVNLTHRPTSTPQGYDPAKERDRQKARKRSQRNVLAMKKRKKKKN